MRTLIVFSVGTLVVYAGLLCATKRGDAKDDRNVPCIVECSDIPKHVKLIGRFGVPLGEEVVTIRGKWKENPGVDKPNFDPAITSNFIFVVTSINGKAIPTPIVIPDASVEPLDSRGSIVAGAGERKWVAGSIEERLPQAFDGDEWEMMGFEKGHTVGFPTTGWPREIRRVMIRQSPYRPGTFVNTFCFVTVRMFNKPHDQSKEYDGHDLGKWEPEDLEEPSENIAPDKRAGGGMF